MFKKKCRCGTTEKNFKMDIGPFFINECCEKAGFDEKGLKAEDCNKEEEALTPLLKEVQKEEKKEILDEKELEEKAEEKSAKISKKKSRKKKAK